MDLFFKNRKMGMMASDPKKCLKELGKIRAELFLRGMADLYVANTLEETRFLPGHYHELTNNRKGQWACELDQPYRLVFEPKEKPIPTDKNGKYIWLEIKSVSIIEITNYHGK